MEAKNSTPARSITTAFGAADDAHRHVDLLGAGDVDPTGKDDLGHPAVQVLNYDRHTRPSRLSRSPAPSKSDNDAVGLHVARRARRREAL